MKTPTPGAAPQMAAEHTKGPLAWQKFGDKWCLTGQYGHRPIVLSTDPKGNLKLRDAARDLLIPFDPSHPDAVLLAATTDLLAALENLVGKIEVMSGCHEVNYTEGHEECYPEFDAARAALAKAKAGAR